MFTLLSAAILGALQVGGATWRTVEVMKGGYASILIASFIISVSYYFSVSYIVDANMVGYVGFSIGAGIANIGLCWYYNPLPKQTFTDKYLEED